MIYGYINTLTFLKYCITYLCIDCNIHLGVLIVS
nr:MAG TPA: hypothetical protein [Caudoviricetes sp.]